MREELLTGREGPASAFVMPVCNALVFVTDFLSTYIPSDGSRQKTLPEWIFGITPDTRRRLDLIEEFPLKPEDLIAAQEDGLVVPPSHPAENRISFQRGCP
jgi:hypothetical protein